MEGELYEGGPPTVLDMKLHERATEFHERRLKTTVKFSSAETGHRNANSETRPGRVGICFVFRFVRTLCIKTSKLEGAAVRKSR